MARSCVNSALISRCIHTSLLRRSTPLPRLAVKAAPPEASLAGTNETVEVTYGSSTEFTAPPLVPSSQILPNDGIAAPPGPMEKFLATPPVRAYMRQLESNPLVTKCWTSFTGFLLGDIVAQLLTEPEFIVDRALILATYGFIIDAPLGNAFYYWLDRNIEPDAPKSGKAVGIKIAIDQLIYAPILTVVLYAYLHFSHGASMDELMPVLQAKVLPTLAANYAIWPAAHALNFYYVPTEQRILYNNFVAVIWTALLSWLAH